MTRRREYCELIRENVLPFEVLAERPSGYAGVFMWLVSRIYEEKAIQKIRTVDFIVAKILNSQGTVYNFLQIRKYSFDLYVIGSFRKTFRPIYFVAEALADFYLEVEILPNIVAVPKHVFMENTRRYVNRIRGGVLIYDRRRGLSADSGAFPAEL